MKYLDERRRDAENRLNAGQVFDQMDEWPSDLEEFDHKLNSAVEGLLDHGPPRTLLDHFDFDTSPTDKMKEEDRNLINLMKGIDAQMSKRRKSNASVWAQLFVIVAITFVSIWALAYMRKGILEKK